MKNPAILLLTVSVLISAAGTLSAHPSNSPEQVAVADVTPAPQAAAPTPSATPAKEKGRFLGIFGKKKQPIPSPTPALDAAASPSPTPQPATKNQSSKPVMKAIQVSTPAPSPAIAAVPEATPTPSPAPKAKKQFSVLAWA